VPTLPFRRSLTRFADNLAGDVTHAVRSMRRQLAFTATAIAILAIGIAVNATVFRFVSALLLQPPPVEAPEQLLELWTVHPKASSPIKYGPLSNPTYELYRDGARSFSGLLAFDGDPHTLSWARGGRGEMVQGQIVSGNFFSLLGVRPTLGTTLLAGDRDAGRSPSVVVSHRFWSEKLGGDATVVGTRISLNGVAFTVAGVAPAGFTGLLAGLGPDVWVPLSMAEAVQHDRGLLARRTTYWLFGVGRLRPGVTREQALAELKAVAARDAELRAATESEEEKGARSEVALFPTALVPGPLRGYVGAFVALLQIVVLMVLIIACANAANLLLAQTAARRPELAVRSALGASRGRLVQHVLAQTLLIGLMAGIGGLLASRVLASLLVRLVPATLPLRFELAPDWRVDAFALVLAVAAGTLFGLGPALKSTGDLTTALWGKALGGRRRSRMRDTLVVAQVAVSLVLLVGGALCWRSLRHAQSTDPGFRVAGRVAAELNLQTLGYSDSAGRILQDRIRDAVTRVPGVRRASAARYLPLGTAMSTMGVKVPGTPSNDGIRPSIQTFDVDAGYFAAMGTPMLLGREFTARDDEHAPKVAIVNEAFAREFSRERSPLGTTLTMATEAGDQQFEVVGVVPTGKYRTLGESPRPVIFRALRQSYQPRMTIVADATGASAGTVLAAMQREIAKLDPDLVVRTATLAEYLGFALFPARASGVALTAAGVLGVVLALVGLAAVVAQSVTQRTREIGVRIALGARPADVVAQLVREGGKLLAIGSGIGLVAALGATRALSGSLYGVSATDPVTFVCASLLLATAALGACALMARRAAGIDPMAAMRSE
jgi:predicted permease